METTLKTLLCLIAVVAMVTGINVLIGGAEAVPGASGPVEATIENELRFFSVYWVAYGVLCFWVARHLTSQGAFIPFLLLFFFFGGIARLLSTLDIGTPAGILLPAMVMELVLPPVIYVLYVKWRNGRTFAQTTAPDTAVGP
ncbi:MAG: DUF4345 domain-containing protein [Oleiphilaceae bacterium]|nr:DUF4345 domain-containing protein [Oleiphilaceae bacterium]